MVSQKALHEFKQVYKEEYGVILNDQIAMELAERTLSLMRAIYRPIKSGSKYVSVYEKNKPKQIK